MTEKEEYLKEPEHVLNARRFEQTVLSSIEPKYPDLMFITINHQEVLMSAQDAVGTGELPEVLQREIGKGKIERWSREAEIQGVDEIEVSVGASRDLTSFHGNDRIVARDKTLKELEAVKKGVEELARKFHGKKAQFREVEDIEEERLPEGESNIGYSSLFVFKRR